MPGPGADPRRYQGDIMKKQVKKLVLSKETLRELDLHIAGGGTLSGRLTCDCASVAYACPGSETTACIC
jgi:hypothetical protein